jgi:hypothetical protein
MLGTERHCVPAVVAYRPALSAFALWALLQLAPAPAAGRDEGSGEAESAAILEIGGMGDREISEGTTRVGSAVGVEIEPIENWLEIELSAARFGKYGATVWEVDLPFKKPYRLSRTIELMIGLGPSWEHTNETGQRTNTWGAEAALDVMFWGESRRIGWFLEPTYGIAFSAGNRKSLGVTLGLLISIR